MKTVEITLDRAKNVNGRLVEMYMKLELGLGDGPLPDMSDVTLSEAVRATEIMRDHPGDPTPKGRILHCVLEDRALARMVPYFWTRAA